MKTRHRLIHVMHRIAEPFRLAYRYVRRPLSVGVRAIVVKEEGSVLLVRHTYVDGWFLPGGGVERREEITSALARELREEVGVKMRQEPELLGIYSNSYGYRSDHVAVFVVRQFVREETICSEIAEARFFPLDDLPPDLNPGTRKRLAEAFDGRQVQFVW